MTDDPLAITLRYTPHAPTVRQHAFHLLDKLEVLEAMYGGAAGGGKSDALLASALRYVDVPGYSALLLRKSYQDLALPGALMERANEWLAGTDARWSGDTFRWTFPSTATLSFGYLATVRDKYRYQGAEFQFIGFDELTQFPKADYLYLFSRLRQPEVTPDLDRRVARQRARLAGVPLRMRSATNPGGRGHHWVKQRFITKTVDDDDPKDSAEKAAARIFVPARLRDNPHVNADTYGAALSQLDPVTRARLEDGDWDVEEGDKVYPSGQVGSARHLGDVLDRMLAAGTMPPPSGDGLLVGVDWGEHSHALIGWPLPGGGVYVVDEVVGESAEPVAFTSLVLDHVAAIVGVGRRPRPAGWRPDLDPITLGRRPVLEPPALRQTGVPASLVLVHQYDAAGIQTMRTYIAQVRRSHPLARTLKVPFGAPAARSGTAGQGKAFKTELIGHVRRLLLRAAFGPALEQMTPEQVLDPPPPPDPPNEEWAGTLAIGGRCKVLRDQLPRLEWDDKEAGTLVKEDDHGPDSLLALVARDALLARKRR